MAKVGRKYESMRDALCLGLNVVSDQALERGGRRETSGGRRTGSDSLAKSSGYRVHGSAAVKFCGVVDR